MIGFVVRRLRARLALAAAALLTVLIATAVLTALVAFDGTVGRAGVQRALQGAGYLRTTVLISGDGGTDVRAQQDARVGQFAKDLFGRRANPVQSLAYSGPFGLPLASPTASADLTVFASIDRGRAQLLGGRWPQASAGAGAPVEAALPEAELQRLGIAATALPARVDLVDRIKGGTFAVLVTGVYRPADSTDPYWSMDGLGGRGSRTEVSTTYGPALVDDSAFTKGVVAQAGRKWLATADFHGLGTAETADLKDRADYLPGDFRSSTGLATSTQLGSFLGELELDQLVARSTLTVGALQLAVLAGAALLLTMHLLTDRQQAENELLTARGASRRRLGAFTAAEATLIALPAAVLSPLLTPLLLRLFSAWGPLAKFRLSTGLPWIAWPVAAACALGCVLIATLPTAFRAVGAVTLRRAGRRQALVAATARSGGDVALLALAVVAYQQLSHYAAGGLSADSAGRIGVDPLLVVAPTLALGAGTVLVLRLLPFAARLGERLAGRGAALAPALVGWQLARRPRRGSGPVLLLVLAVSVGVLALGQRSAWSLSQRDQADFTTAGGLRITESSAHALGQGGLYTGIPGGDRSIPVARSEQSLATGIRAEILAVGADSAARNLRIRPDLLDGRTADQLLRPLVPDPVTGPAAGIVLPGRPSRIDLDVSNHVTGAAPVALGSPPVPRSAVQSQPSLELLLRDRFGVTCQLIVPGVPEEGEATVSADLSPCLGPGGSVAAPLSIIGIEASVELFQNIDYTGVLTVGRIAASDTPGGPAAPAVPPAGLNWWMDAHMGVVRFPAEGTSATADAGHPLILDYHGGPGNGALSVTLEPADSQRHTAPTPQVNAVATRSYLDAVGASVGDTVTVPFGRSGVAAHITAAVGSLPTTHGPTLLVDFDALNRNLLDQGSSPESPGEWWLPGDGPNDPTPAAAAAALRASAAHQSLQLREEVAAALLNDPLSAAPQNALAALAVAAAVLAAVGFAAATAGAAAERRGEFSVLVALGASRRTLARTVAAEQGVLVLLGIGVGLGLGTLLAHLVVPLVVLTSAGRPPVPEVMVRIPLGQVAVLAAVVAVAVLVPALLQGRRQSDLTARLRHVEEM